MIYLVYMDVDYCPCVQYVAGSISDACRWIGENVVRELHSEIDIDEYVIGSAQPVRRYRSDGQPRTY